MEGNKNGFNLLDRLGLIFGDLIPENFQGAPVLRSCQQILPVISPFLFYQRFASPGIKRRFAKWFVRKISFAITG